jgi:hypothetical protein
MIPSTSRTTWSSGLVVSMIRPFALHRTNAAPSPPERRFAPPPPARLSPDAVRHGINAAEHEYGGLTQEPAQSAISANTMG